MKKDSIFSLLRYILVIVGGWLVGKNFLGNPIDETTSLGIVGGFMSLVGLVWGFVDKTVTLEGFQSSIKGLLSFVGTLFVASGKITSDTLNAILGGAVILLPIVYGVLSKQKTNGILNGTIDPATLKNSLAPPGNDPKKP